MGAELVGDKYGTDIQVFPLTKGKINKTTGTVTDCTLVCCVEDGSITLVDFGDSVAMVAGDVYAFSVQSVTVTSGKFHLA
jgi:hypothetical protein